MPPSSKNSGHPGPHWTTPSHYPPPSFLEHFLSKDLTHSLDIPNARETVDRPICRPTRDWSSHLSRLSSGSCSSSELLADWSSENREGMVGAPLTVLTVAGKPDTYAATSLMLHASFLPCNSPQ